MLQEDSGLSECRQGYRMYWESDINEIIGDKEESETEVLPVAVYCRVSSNDHKQKGDLERQKGRVLDYCVKQGYKVHKVFEEVSSGMNDNRTKLKALFKLVTEHKINRVVVECQQNFMDVAALKTAKRNRLKVVRIIRLT